MSAPGEGGAEPVLLGGAHLHQLAPAHHQGAEFLGGGIGQGAQGGPDGLGEVRQHLGIEGIGLGQLARGPGEVPHLAGVHDRHGQLGGAALPRQGQLDAPGGFDYDEVRGQ